MTRRMRWWLVLLLALTGLGLAGGCSTVGYYAQSMHGHFSMLHEARPISELLADPTLDPKLRAKLQRVQQVRAYASRELGLPDNRSYTEYADLHRPYVLWNVYAAPELSLTLRKSCFPVAGCVGYRGYFDQADAERYAAQMRANGDDVQVSGVPAYSTLGWFDDPVLNTFINQPDGELARLIFHELGHQVVYVKGDTTFNESFATTVETEGLKRWLAAQNDPALTESYRSYDARRKDFLGLLYTTKDKLAAIYASAADDDTKRAQKRAAFAQLQRDYETLKREHWGGYTGYDRYFAQTLGNAHLASVAAYTQLVPAFEALLAQADGDLPRFYEAVRALAALDAPARLDRLASACAECVARVRAEAATTDAH